WVIPVVAAFFALTGAASTTFIARWYRTAKLGYFLGILIGTCGGYLAFVLAYNLEDWPFYRLRSWVTGKTAIAEIIEQPADDWITLVLLLLLILSGVTIGIFIARRIQQRTGT